MNRPFHRYGNKAIKALSERKANEASHTQTTYKLHLNIDIVAII